MESPGQDTPKHTRFVSRVILPDRALCRSESGIFTKVRPRGALDAKFVASLGELIADNTAPVDSGAVGRDWPGGDRDMKTKRGYRPVASTPSPPHATIIPYGLGSSAEGRFSSIAEAVDFLAKRHGVAIVVGQREFIGLAAAWRYQVLNPGLRHLAILWYPSASELEGDYDGCNVIYRPVTPHVP